MCFFFLSTAQKVDMVMSHFGKAVDISQIEETEFPQLICGRILPAEELLVAPISGRSCVYYEALIEESFDPTEVNTLASKSGKNGKVWESLCGEVKASDFTLIDPKYPNESLYIPGTQFPVKVHATDDTDSLELNKKKIYQHHLEKIPEYTKDFLKKHKINIEKLQKNNSELKYREASFEFGEQIAVLGIVKTIHDSDGTPVKILFPVNSDILTKEFCKNKGWSDKDMKSFRDLTKEPSIILTDIKEYFQGLEIEPLSLKLSFAQILPIDVKKYIESK